MKIKSLLIGMLACSALVACTNEDSPVNGENNKFDGDKAYLAVNIVTSEANSRAAGAEAYVDGTGNECAVGKARFYFFNADGSAYTNTTTAKNANYYETNLTLNKDEDNDNEEYQSTAILVIGTDQNGETAGTPYSIVAVLNPETAATELGTDPLTLDQLKSKSGDYRKFGANEFLMTNSVYANEGETKMEVFIKPENLATTAEAALDNPVVIHVERVAAKMTYTTEFNNKFPTGITVEGKAVYAKVTGIAPAHENPVSNLIKAITPTWTNQVLGFGQYNWNNAANYRSYWATSAEPDAYNNISSWNDANEKAYAYCLESTYAPEENRTEAMFAAKLVDAEDQDFEIAEWMGKQYAGGEDALQIAMANYLKNFWYDKDGKKETFNPEHLIFKTLADVANLGIKGYEVKAVLSDEAPTYYIKDADGGYTATNVTAMLQAEIAKFAPAKIWKSGTTYYFTPIEHLGVDGSVAEYGVVRNHVYQINVKSITGLGTPVYKPETDVPTVVPESDESFVAAEIHVLAWRVVNQEVELGK